MNTRRKTIRLSPEVYQNPGNVFSVTICTWHKKPLFNSAVYSESIIETLHHGLFAEKTNLFAYCLMPDHIHMLVSSKGDNLRELINRWKSYTSNQLRKEGLKCKCWQRSFYDHALRNEESLETTAGYIINNPVRAGLVTHWQDYAYSWHKCI